MAGPPPVLMYGNASQQFASGAFNWTALTVWGMLVASTYVPQINKDVHVSDIPSGAILARSGPMTGLTNVNGVCYGVLPQFSQLLTTVPATAIVLYINSGSDSTSQLLYYCSNGAGFPFLPQGFNYAVAADQSAGGWFQV